MSVRETALLLVHLAGVYGHCDRAKGACRTASFFTLSEAKIRQTGTITQLGAACDYGCRRWRLQPPHDPHRVQSSPRTSPNQPRTAQTVFKTFQGRAHTIPGSFFFRDAYPQDESRTHEGVPKRGQAAQDAPKTRRGRTMTVL